VLLTQYEAACPRSGTFAPARRFAAQDKRHTPRSSGGDSQEANMNGIIYLIGLIVVILAILSFFGLR